MERTTVLLPLCSGDTSGHYAVLLSPPYQEEAGTGWNSCCALWTLLSAFTLQIHACFADSAAVETFLSDTAPGPKVLLCVNAPGVQQPLEGLAGVDTVRQSA